MRVDWYPFFVSPFSCARVVTFAVDSVATVHKAMYDILSRSAFLPIMVAKLLCVTKQWRGVFVEDVLDVDELACRRRRTVQHEVVRRFA